jgi:hypothetical protein
MNTIKLLNFNSYYNRQYKKLPDNWEEEYSPIEQTNVNFDPNDGVNTTLILNMPSNVEDNINYCLVLDDNYDIQSRWFVIDAIRTRLNQYQVTLRRDLLAEYFDEITHAPVFIEKATLDADNPLIFNAEDMSFNQIKTKEYVLKDPSGCPWIIGYFNKEYASQEKTFKTPTGTVPSYIAYSSFDEVPFIDALRAGSIKGALSSPVTFEMRPYFRVLSSASVPYGFKFNTNKQIEVSIKQWGKGYINMIASPETATFQSMCDEIIDAYKATTTWQSAITGDLMSSNQESSFLSTYPTTGKTIRVGTAESGYEYYKITRGATHTYAKSFNLEVGSLEYNYMKREAVATKKVDVYQDSNDNFSCSYEYKSYDIRMEKLADPESYHITIPANDRRARLIDAPYDMFAIPYGNLAIVNSDDYLFVMEKDIALYAAQALSTALGGTTENLLFDLQLLPYCPITNIEAYDRLLEHQDGYINIAQLTEGIDYTWIHTGDSTSADDVKQIIFFPQKSEFSFNLSHMWDGSTKIPTTIEITEKKVQALCDTYRLVSPNYNGQFEFNAAKNGGITYFNIDCSYKPYTPYIHINPDFGELYGSDFNDARGLVCGGDFSLPTITDQWISYQINNKNYLNSFNRQIDNMEISNQYAFQSDKIAAIAGTVQGAVSGASTGMVAGNTFGPKGAAIGAITGGVIGAGVSGWAGRQDMRINEALRGEALNYAVDQFGY